jgi:hypothetical protein
VHREAHIVDGADDRRWREQTVAADEVFGEPPNVEQRRQERSPGLMPGTAASRVLV